MRNLTVDGVVARPFSPLEEDPSKSTAVVVHHPRGREQSNFDPSNKELTERQLFVVVEVDTDKAPKLEKGAAVRVAGEITGVTREGNFMPVRVSGEVTVHTTRPRWTNEVTLENFEQSAATVSGFPRTNRDRDAWKNFNAYVAGLSFSVGARNNEAADITPDPKKPRELPLLSKITGRLTVRIINSHPRFFVYGPHFERARSIETTRTAEERTPARAADAERAATPTQVEKQTVAASSQPSVQQAAVARLEHAIDRLTDDVTLKPLPTAWDDGTPLPEEPDAGYDPGLREGQEAVAATGVVAQRQTRPTDMHIGF